MSFNSAKTDFNVALAKLFCRLPLSWQLAGGRMLGRLFYWLPNRRRRIAAINIDLCFPDYKDPKALLKANLIATGQGVTEMLAALWFQPKGLSAGTMNRFTFSGFKHLETVLQQGNGCLLLSCHTTSIEWGIRGLNKKLADLNLPVGHMLARQHNNKDLEAHLEQARLGFVEKVIDKKNIRSLLQSIKSGHPVYYAPDQNFSYKVKFAQFFGRPAATTTGTQNLAQKGVKVVPWFCFRTGPSQWHIEILPEMSNLGDVDEAAASAQINQLFEHQIQKHPEQYLWVHRRFKNQPEGYENPYK
ncbi:lysophospholipid acyltransferase family protein [Marinicella gelatinilytica]|uniref:lysophospholipid acyltransferase family protein n=1 Tax=Marinicella gelatinilytica TaxID=2996017 RepID=UPI00226086AC|nr:lysophospholipid acyltransferase family protein [Marinicella gelatinilytica]MCX7545091.1 lysophospholipid acyltransferase family protein [Marinicella gelatinilytica]